MTTQTNSLQTFRLSLKLNGMNQELEVTVKFPSGDHGLNDLLARHVPPLLLLWLPVVYSILCPDLDLRLEPAAPCEDVLIYSFNGTAPANWTQGWYRVEQSPS